NPVYKIQYAHARMCSIFRKAAEGAPVGAGGGGATEAAPPARPGAADLSLLATEEERALLGRLSEFPATVRRAAEHTAPHILCDYLEQTAAAVNSWYHAGNPTRNPELAVLVDDPDLRSARLALAQAVRVVLRNGLDILGITAPERMLREVEADAA